MFVESFRWDLIFSHLEISAKNVNMGNKTLSVTSSLITPFVASKPLLLVTQLAGACPLDHFLRLSVDHTVLKWAITILTSEIYDQHRSVLSGWLDNLHTPTWRSRPSREFYHPFPWCPIVIIYQEVAQTCYGPITFGATSYSTRVIFYLTTHAFSATASLEVIIPAPQDHLLDWKKE